MSGPDFSLGAAVDFYPDGADANHNVLPPIRGRVAFVTRTVGVEVRYHVVLANGDTVWARADQVALAADV